VLSDYVVWISAAAVFPSWYEIEFLRILMFIGILERSTKNS